MHDEVALSELLRAKGTALFSGRIEVRVEGSSGVLLMSEGQVVDARFGTATGEPALWRMLLATIADVRAVAERSHATSGAVLGNPEALLVRFEIRLALLTRNAEGVGGLERVWALRFDALVGALDHLPDAINPLLRLFDGRRSVRRVVMDCALDGLLALRIIRKLVASGILVVPDELPDEAAGRGGLVKAFDNDGGLQAAIAATLAEIDAEELLAASLLERGPLEHASPTGASTPAMSGDAAQAMATANLPSAPTPEIIDDLRSWLGDDALVGAERHDAPSAAAARGPSGTIGVVPKVLLFLFAVAFGALLATSR